MMKQILSFVLAGVLGGLVVLGGLQLTSTSEKEETSQVQLTSNTTTAQQQAIDYATFPFDFKAAAKVSTPAVVHIEAKEITPTVNNDRKDMSPFDLFFGDGGGFGNFGPKAGSGSGVIYTEDGYIITNNHVVDFADEVMVILSDNRQFKAEVIGTYPEADLAVLKIDASGLPTLEVANSDNAEVGEWVLAVGNPFNLTSTVTAGIISAKGRSINAISAQNPNTNAIESFIQTDAAVNPGNSGGALVDAEGKLLGINTAIATRTGNFAGYSFAIPINLAKRIVDDIIENGDYERAMLGVQVFDLTSKDPLVKKDIAELNISEDITQGVAVFRVEDGSAAQYAGVLPRDVIVGLNEKSIRNFPELQEAISSLRVGETITLQVYRQGKYIEVPVKLKAGRG